MSEQQDMRATRDRGTVRITIPAAVAYNLEAFQKGIATLVERLGCRSCFSGADCTFQLERDFVINEKLEISQAGTRLMSTDPDGDPVLPLRGVTATLPHTVSYDLKQVQSIVASIAGKLGCGACCSGFDIRFLHERELLIDESQRIHAR